MSSGSPLLLTIDARAPGRRRPLVPEWRIPIPRDEAGGSEPLTLRALISRIVLAEVAGFEARKRADRLLRVLTAQEIDDGVSSGRVVPGGQEHDRFVDEDHAVGTALQAFEDGVYLVLLDGEEQRDLDAQVSVGPQSHLTFLRLVALAGG